MDKKFADNMLEIIKAKGGRITKFRRLLAVFLTQAEAPQSAADILRVLKTAISSLNRSTVYRELAHLVSLGAIKEVNLAGSPPLYELASGHRHHLVCLGCNRVQPIEMHDELVETETIIGKEKGFVVRGHSLEFYGLCSECQEGRNNIK